MHLSAACLAACLLPAAAAHAGPVADRVRSSGIVRVCIWPQYYGISFRNPRNQQLTGIDIDLSAQLGRDMNLKVQYVDSSFASLVADITQDRCDIAMFAVGMTPERQRHLKFTSPYLESDIYGVTTRANRLVRRWEDIDQPGVRVAVQAGTVMEPVMAAALKRAEMVVIRPPLTREQELESGRVDVFMTDYPYSRRLLDNADWARLVSPPRPFNPIPYAYAVRPDDPEWLAQADEFVRSIKRDGRLQAAAMQHRLDSIAITR